MTKYFFIKESLFLFVLVCVASTLVVAQTTKQSRLRPYQGTDEYRDLVVGGGTYVDKTFMIRDVIEAERKTILVTRPRRWGKSTNLSMLRHFFRVEVDESGELVELNSNLVLFEGGEGDFGGLVGRKTLPRSKIAQEPLWESKYKAMQGTYPVIFLSLKDIKDGSYNALEIAIRNEISRAYEAHAYVGKRLEERIADPAVSIREAEFLRAKLGVFDKFYISRGKNATIEELRDSLKFLSELLYQHHKKRVFILIDEYDTPLNEAYLNGYFAEASKLMAGIFGSALKGNDALEKGIITGILRIAKANLFSGLNNFTEDSVLTKSEGGEGSFAHYYGFTEDEVGALIKAARFDKHVKEVKAYYNGYNIDGVEIYNPWSIVSFLQTGIVEPYWVGTGGTGLLDKAIIAPEVQEDIRILREGKSIVKRFRKDIDVFKLENDSDALWALLLYAGYLTPAGQVTLDGDDFYTASLRIPNKEVKAPFGTFYNQYLQQADPTGTLKKANALYDAVLKKQLSTVQTELRGTDFSSAGWNLNVLHLAALVGDSAVFDAAYEQHKGLLKSQGLERFTAKDFAFLAGHDYKQLKGYKTVLEQLGWTETVLCSNVTKLAAVAGVALLVKKAMRLAVDARQPAAPAPQPVRGGRQARVNIVGDQLHMWQRWGVPGLQWVLSLGAGFLSKDFVARKIAGDCKSYNRYHEVDISKPASMNSLLQFEKYRMEHSYSYVVANAACKAKDLSVASMDITPFDLKPAPVKSVRLTLCQPHQRDAGL